MTPFAIAFLLALTLATATRRLYESLAAETGAAVLVDSSKSAAFLPFLARIPGVAEVIGSRVGIPAEKGDPFGQMKLSPRARASGVMRDATALLTACGLALRSFD